MPKRIDAMRIIPIIMITFILTGAICSCKDDPVTPKPGTCDTCVCDTCDTTDTVIVTPNDTSSHDFVWTEYSLSGESSISGCWVFSDTEIWIAGRDFYKLKHGAWERVTVVGSGTTIFGFTSTDAWFLYGSILNHFNGSTFKETRFYEDGINLLTPDQDGPLRQMWGTSSNDLFVVGDRGTIIHFDGTNWTKFPKVTEKKLQSIWGTSSNDVYACGFDLSTAETILLHYDGSAWSEVDISQQKGAYATGGFNTVWTSDSADHKIVLTAGAILIKRTDNNSWRSDSGLVKNRLGDGGFVPLYTIRGNSANDVMLAGTGGWIGHWNGVSWHQYESLYNYNEPGYTTGPMSLKGNTAAFAGKRSGKGFVAVGRRAK
jgi:hypothetical protein